LSSRSSPDLLLTWYVYVVNLGGGRAVADEDATISGERGSRAGELAEQNVISHFEAGGVGVGPAASITGGEFYPSPPPADLAEDGKLTRKSRKGRRQTSSSSY
jgi:hypothetical protein